MKQRLMNIHLLNVYICIFFLCGGFSFSYALPDQSEELLDYLLTKNEAARAKIKSYSCSLEIIDKSREYTAQIKQQGNCLWLFNHPPFSNNMPIGDLQQRIVVNERYAAEYQFQTPMIAMSNARRWDHDSFETMDSKLKQRIQNQTPNDFFVNCFGSSVESLRQSITRRPDIHWDAVQTSDPNGRSVYHIRRFYGSENPEKPDKIWVIDPDKGFLATETLSYRALTGEIWIHRSMKVQQVSEGIWFPIFYRQERNELNDNNRQTPQVRTIKLQDLQVNIDIPAEQFEINALKLKQDVPDILILRAQTDGTKVPYIYDDKGDLVPQNPPGARR